MTDKLLLLGLKKAAVVMHAIACQMKEEKSRKELLSLVTVISDAAYRLEDLSNGK